MPKKYIHEAGQRFGRLVVIERAAERVHGQIMWRCACDCGRETVTGGARLASGNVRSCGCLREEMRRERWLIHGKNRAGARSRIYRIWNGMKNRCQKPSQPHYERYGARGVTVCDRWQEFTAFYADMGDPPTDEHTLDRIDNDRGYEPGNCRWATRSEQARNKRPRRKRAG